MTNIIYAEFPFNQIHGDDGDFFHRPADLKARGYAESQIWSVVVTDEDESLDPDDDRWIYYVYGPSGHYVNVLGYIATEEHHDGKTYYQEAVQMEPL